MFDLSAHKTISLIQGQAEDMESEWTIEAQWPENGGSWSDTENEAGMDSDLLQAMAEEDEEINIFNEETFGMEPLPSTPPPNTDPKPLSPSTSPPSPPRQRPQYLPQYPARAAQWQRIRGPRWRGGLGRGQMFDDPAVMRIVEGRPSLMSVDSAIVDCGHAVYRNTSLDNVRAKTSISFGCRWRGFMFPPNRPCPSTPRPLTPKIMQLRFGADSPRPSPFYSPSTNRVYGDPVTQLHPQHKRLLSQKQHLKSQGSDPYCNLMTTKEKEWIIRLQMIQLQMNFRLASHLSSQRRTSQKLMHTSSGLSVFHIEGSLGQVAVSTCYSPRRAISAVNAELKDTRQQRLEILSKIEKLFIVLLEVEETERMKTPVSSEAEDAMLLEKIQRKVEHIYSELQHHDSLDSGTEFLPVLSVSKGKKLLARLLPFLKNDSAIKILHIIASNLPTVMSKDTEETLPVLYLPLRNVIGGLTFSQLIKVLRDLTSSESLSTLECLSLACQNKFGLTLLYALLSHGEKLLSSGVPLEPSIGDFETWTDIIFQVAGQLSQCSLVEPLLLPSNLLTLFCRYLDKRTVHQLKSNLE
uniref:PAT1 homolog 2 n=1 Tax=Cyprinodon variegatus TaxID=28743 RepID=A0A3Q2D5I2_CYPVA